MKRALLFVLALAAATPFARILVADLVQHRWGRFGLGRSGGCIRTCTFIRIAEPLEIGGKAFRLDLPGQGGAQLHGLTAGQQLTHQVLSRSQSALTQSTT